MQDKLANNPMSADLSWFTWYGFGLLTGLSKGREVATLRTNNNGYSLVQDIHTRRKFIKSQKDGGCLVQFFEEDMHYFE